ncbi:MAG: 50S ribosomal protein L25 [Gammaproteobacteria bacterium HGW-Gammaproteobacteria-1]|jgi:large subunit ribosomal protein L25|nr:MAG: 50S ribosomal protein L25 [Gammaproteobacteria bacterium HGW-Gammaproteobacteria-1]
MKNDFVMEASLRNDLGKGASRRLRREGKVPAVLYGGHKDATSLTMSHNELFHHLENEAFYSHILTIKIDGKDEQAVLKDLQRHPYKPVITHVDFQRVSASEKIRMHVPLHFVGGDMAPGVKVGGGIVTHNMNEVEVSCLPKDLPEFLEVDLSNCELNHSIHMSELKLGAGVELVELAHGHDLPVGGVHATRATVSEEGGAAAAEGEGA